MSETFTTDQERFLAASPLLAPFAVNDEWLLADVPQMRGYFDIAAEHADPAEDELDLSQVLTTAYDDVVYPHRRTLKIAAPDATRQLCTAGARVLAFGGNPEEGMEEISQIMSPIFNAWRQVDEDADPEAALKETMSEVSVTIKQAHALSTELDQEVRSALEDDPTAQYEVLKSLATGQAALEHGDKQAPSLLFGRMLAVAELRNGAPSLINDLRRRLEHGEYETFVARDLLHTALTVAPEQDTPLHKLKSLMHLIAECGGKEPEDLIEPMAARVRRWPTDSRHIYEAARQELAKALLNVQHHARDSVIKDGFSSARYRDEDAFIDSFQQYVQGMRLPGARGRGSRKRGFTGSSMPPRARRMIRTLQSKAAAQQVQLRRSAAQREKEASAPELLSEPRPLVCFAPDGSEHGQDSELFTAMIEEYLDTHRGASGLEEDLHKALRTLERIEGEKGNVGVKRYVNKMFMVAGEKHQVYGFKPDSVPQRRPSTEMGRRIRVLFTRLPDKKIGIFEITDKTKVQTAILRRAVKVK